MTRTLLLALVALTVVMVTGLVLAPVLEASR